MCPCRGGHSQGYEGASPPVSVIDELRNLLKVGVPIHHHRLRVCQLQWGQGVGKVIQPVNGRGQHLEGTQESGTRGLAWLCCILLSMLSSWGRNCVFWEGPKVPHHSRSFSAPLMLLMLQDKEGTPGPHNTRWQLPPDGNNCGHGHCSSTPSACPRADGAAQGVPE